MVEHAAVNRVVVGSSPTSGAISISRWRTTTAPAAGSKKRAKTARKGPSVQ